MREGTLYSTDLYNRFIEYSLIVNYIGVIFSLIIFPISVYLIYKAFKSYDEYDWQQPTLCIPGVIGVITSIIVIVVSISSIIQIIYLPELYLINYF